MPESGDMAFGSALHSAVNGALTGQNGEELFDLYWSTYDLKEVAYGRFKWAELKELGLNFISKFSRLHAKKYEVTHAEKRLYSEYKGIRLEGTPDFIGMYQGKRSLRDFKTSGYNYDKEKQDLALQLYLYAYLAIQCEGFTPETLGYDVFNKGTGSIQTMTWDFDEAKMYDMLDNMVAYCKQIDAVTEHPKNPNGCMFGKSKCGMYEVCWGKNERT